MSAVLLGLRLALAPASRWRSLAMVLAAAVGGLVLLIAAATAHAQIETAATFQKEMPRMMAAMLLTIGIPCALLVGTVGRLAASLRDRRLANLRLIGLTPSQTRVAGAVESGAGALVGTALAWPLWWAVRAPLAETGIVGEKWADEVFVPSTVAQVLIALGLPAIVVLLAVLPQHGDAQKALERVRRTDRRPPGSWRLVPLLAGVAACLVFLVNPPEGEYTDAQSWFLIGTIALTGVGLLLVVPVFVRLAAALLVRFARGPIGRIAGRRLEAQPVGVTRIVSALLIGLFVVTGARFVLVAFESTPQYLAAERSMQQEQRVVIDTTASHQARVATLARTAPEVTSVTAVPRLRTACEEPHHACVEAMVLSCDQLRRVAPEIAGCRDDRVMWIQPWHADPDALPSGHEPPAELTWLAGSEDLGGPREVLTTPYQLPTLAPSPDDPDNHLALHPLYADVIIPPSLVGDLPPSTHYGVLVTGPPGRDLLDRLATLPWPEGHHGFTPGGTDEDFAFVERMRAIIWTVAGAVIAIGLLTFGIASIDRAVERRKEVVSLQLVGVPRGVLRAAQWVEAIIPIGVGSVLAVGLGALAGAAYLTIEGSLRMPWAQSGTLAGVAFLAAAMVAGLTVVASAPRIRPDQIRRE